MLSENSSGSVLLVDGMALLFRGYYATSSSGYIMKTENGVPINGVYGFLKYLLDAIQTFKPSHVVCCWDMGSKTFRTEKFEAYKANRGPAPEELIPQFDLVKEVTASFNIPNIGVVGYEADDCIGTLARTYSPLTKVQILTGDHDMLQLVNESTEVIIMKKGHSNYMVYTLETLMEEKSLTPAQIIDLKGLTGDTADNYPGVKGIGEKTATKLLNEYQDIGGILENLAALPKGVRAKIEAELEMLHLSRDLATIRLDAPVACALEDCGWAMEREKVIAKFEEIAYKGLIKLIG
ncbi:MULTISPECIES: 5'-3' exonuclease [Paenibacillus]|uniref:5'-3' exonuclease n=1 Tax=Paenibacillus violae TaxID=3077234 RepID=A0ABU3RFZ1_9BACL|nr:MULTISPECIES: 5'-3' exonuclease H3TH domain-containing protein [Paenibacillus]MDU0203205.1 5'-3' exonuclease H3TH domain-containing protein [Paenibacillus sp. PFR10]MEC0270742.1 5'-3' exonuclease H3TH domain-containing protein [Paenibacillus anseongense]